MSKQEFINNDSDYRIPVFVEHIAQFVCSLLCLTTFIANKIIISFSRLFLKGLNFLLISSTTLKTGICIHYTIYINIHIYIYIRQRFKTTIGKYNIDFNSSFVWFYIPCRFRFYFFKISAFYTHVYFFTGKKFFHEKKGDIIYL